MEYEVWTDAACDQDAGIMASAFFIRTNKCFIDMGVVSDKGNSIAMAETLALGYGAKALLSQVSVQPEDTVVFWTDSLSTMKFLKGVKSKGERLSLGFKPGRKEDKDSIKLNDTMTFWKNDTGDMIMLRGNHIKDDAKSFKVIGSKAVTKDERVMEAWDTLQMLSIMCTVKVSKAEAHRKEFSCNKVADRLAKYAIGTVKSCGGL